MFARVLLGCMVVCAMSCALLAEEPKEKPFKPLLVFDGSHSAVRQDRIDLCTTAKEWEVVWSKHRGEEAEPQFTETRQALDINFDTHYLVAIFTRDKQECVVTTFARENAVVVRYDAHYLQIVGRFGGGEKRSKFQKAKENAVAAYAFVVLPKPVKTVIIEQGLRADLTQPFVWKEQKRFPAPKGK